MGKGNQTRHSRLQKTGARSPLLEQELAQRELLKACEEELADQMGLGRKGNRIPLMVLIPAGLFVVLAVVGALIVSSRSGSRPQTEDREAKIKVPAQAADRYVEAEASVEEAGVSGLKPAEAAEQFLDARSRAERLDLTRNREALESRLPEFAAEVAVHPIEYTSLVPLGAASASGELRVQRFAVTMADGSRRLLCVAQTLTGPLVDYESFARYGTASWDDLLEGKAGEEMRVVVEKSVYYNYQFTDETAWAAFKISDPDWPGTMTGYARRDSATAGVLEQILANGPKQRVILKIRPQGESYRHRQVVIEKVLASGWVLTEGDIEAKWLLQHGE